MTDQFAFSSIGRPEQEAFEEYVQLYSNGSDVTRGEGPFRAEVQAWRLHASLLFDRRLTGVVHSRGARIVQDGFDHIVLHAVLEGRLFGSEASGFEVAEPGDMLFVDAAQPSRTTMQDVRMLTLSVSRHVIEGAISNPGRLHGLIVRPPATLMLTDFIVSLARWADALVPDDMPAYSRAMVELVAITLRGGVLAGAEARRVDFLRREAVERCIAANLSDRTLSAETIATETGISRSALYRLLQSRGGVARLIQRRRLQAVRSAIDNGNAAPLADLASAYGFATESHMSRLFTESFGESPGAYRDAMNSLAADDARAGHRRWEGWMGSIG